MAKVLTSVNVDTKLKRRIQKVDKAQKPRPIGWTNQLVLLAEEALDRRDAEAAG